MVMLGAVSNPRAMPVSQSVAANQSVNGTACKLRLQVPSALRAPAAPYLKR
ncbi:hypothetical protein GCM10025770_08310 [Viridibacterium curvum]|uniref:Uncharacterized protein n=1 Tax=Viridibacterium curvum TaxID=1101404 RepID=A0ABP9QEE2_9RHOO